MILKQFKVVRMLNSVRVEFTLSAEAIEDIPLSLIVMTEKHKSRRIIKQETNTPYLSMLVLN